MIKLILFGTLVANVILLSIATPTSTDCDDRIQPQLPQRKCKKNERYEVCPPAYCVPKTCDDLGYAVGCAGAGPGGTCPGKPDCICVDGYVRNDKGKCIPMKECPSCGGDPNAESGCGANCGRRCSNYPKSDEECKCRNNGCDCKKGYVYDYNINKCVRPKYCTPTCGKNQRYSSCVQAECRLLNCEDKIKNLSCPRIRPEDCKQSCVCVEGYLKNENGKCVPEDQCNNCNSDNNNPGNNNPGNNNPGNNNPGNNNPGNNNPGNNNPGNSVNDTEVQAKFNLGLADFASKSLNLLVKKNPGKSVFESALSVEIPLASLTLYAEGSSRDELLKLLNLANKDEVRSAFKTAISEIKSENVTMDIANKVYLNKEYQLSEAFSKDSVDVFNAPAEEIAVGNPQQAADTINKWVEDQTKGRIKNLIPASAITDLTRLILVNAIYFKGFWKYQFNEDNTQDQDFYVTPDQTVKVPTMYQKNKFLYAENEELGAQVLELPYTDENFRMICILPYEKDGLQRTLDKLNGQTLTTAINSLSKTEVSVYLPKFKIETSIELIEILRACGVTKIFDASDSGLEGILKEPASLSVTGAIQKAFLEVNEKGSEAAAATDFCKFVRKYIKKIKNDSKVPDETEGYLASLIGSTE